MHNSIDCSRLYTPGPVIIATASIINVVTGLVFKQPRHYNRCCYPLYNGWRFCRCSGKLRMHVLFITIGMAVAMFIMAENPAVGGFSVLFATKQQL